MNRTVNWPGIVLLLLLTSMLTACGGSNSVYPGRVAVIDLDAIAVATGRNDIIRNTIAESAKQREANLIKLQNELSAIVDTEKDKIGKKPSTKQKQSLQEMVDKARQKLRQSIALAKQETQQLRLKLINDFKQEILPIAVKVATKNNYSVVLLKSPNLFYVDADANITKAVIADLGIKTE